MASNSYGSVYQKQRFRPPSTYVGLRYTGEDGRSVKSLSANQVNPPPSIVRFVASL